MSTETTEITEIYQFGSRKEWLEKINEAPATSLIKSRSLGSGKSSRYVPLGIQEALADMFFRECDIMDETIEVFSNKVYDHKQKKMVDNDQAIVKVKLSVLPNYPNAEHRIISGIGAKMITSAKNSLEYGAPASQSAAKSNALTNFANIFGRNLNREFSDGFTFIKKTVGPETTGGDDTTNKKD